MNIQRAIVFSLITIILSGCSDDTPDISALDKKKIHEINLHVNDPYFFSSYLMPGESSAEYSACSETQFKKMKKKYDYNKSCNKLIATVYKDGNANRVKFSGATNILSGKVLGYDYIVSENELEEESTHNTHLYLKVNTTKGVYYMPPYGVTFYKTELEYKKLHSDFDKFQLRMLNKNKSSDDISSS